VTCRERAASPRSDTNRAKSGAIRPPAAAGSGDAIRPATHVASRTCVGCGRKAAKHELARFVAADSTLTLDPNGQAPGRGAYTCRRAVCFERAVDRRAFSRTLRTNVRVPPGLNPFSEG